MKIFKILLLFASISSSAFAGSHPKSVDILIIKSEKIGSSVIGYDQNNQARIKISKKICGYIPVMRRSEVAYKVSFFSEQGQVVIGMNESCPDNSTPFGLNFESMLAAENLEQRILKAGICHANLTVSIYGKLLSLSTCRL